MKISSCHLFVRLQTAVISYDYLTAFRHVENGTDEYWDLKSKVENHFVSVGMGEMLLLLLVIIITVLEMWFSVPI